MNPSCEASFETLDPVRIRELISRPSLGHLARLTVLRETDSTNSALQRLPVEKQHAHALLAESQTGGRGRQQRNWFSPSGYNVYLSLGWQFAGGKQPLSTLPLAVAVCTCRALARTGLKGHGIKWPNDILAGGAKLAGILVELQAVAAGPAQAVIGVGINVSMPKHSAVRTEADASIDRSWTDIASQMPRGSAAVTRNQVAAVLLDELLAGVRKYSSAGFSAFTKEWAAHDLLRGRKVQVWHQESSTGGIARGISEDG
jgi:BirA family biotin operon repressor/biotin-[acetyl-CoA-carboxylase] ligase